jgi:hypothetical protein
VTNVPGPQHPLRTLDRRLLESFPFVPLLGNVRISIAIFSYDGGLYFGVTADYDSSRDIHILTSGVERSIAELLEVVDRPPPRPRAAEAARPREEPPPPPA